MGTKWEDTVTKTYIKKLETELHNFRKLLAEGKLVKLAKKQEVDLTALETIGSTEPIHFRVYRMMWEQGWRRCL